ncbi:MAG: hypothetical protein HYY40_06950 [Bacteroidetes bacterium]|nr:hypothetical protein [Bacteroidota bacterium]
MGYLESAVVVYLRIVYYPEGFSFPLLPLEPWVALTELGREAATLIMLFSIGYLCGKNFTQRIAWFLYCFAVWDIFYYVFLKIILDWPESFFTYDILFLLPVPWIGPVLSPVITSLTMIILALCLIYFNMKNETVILKKKEWFLLFAGSALVLISWTYDYIRYVYEHAGDTGIWMPGNAEKLFAEGFNYVPDYYNWWLFAAGEFFYLIAIYLFVIRANTRTESAK